jgi:hypothetical protein
MKIQTARDKAIALFCDVLRGRPHETWMSVAKLQRRKRVKVPVETRPSWDYKIITAHSGKGTN